MTDARVRSFPCPACGAAVGAPCFTPIDGIDTQWDHDARILSPMLADLRGAGK